MFYYQERTNIPKTPQESIWRKNLIYYLKCIHHTRYQLGLVQLVKGPQNIAFNLE